MTPNATKTFEPETGDIGPKTYGRILELLLRLKANLIWPAMHSSTKAFYHYPDNGKVAANYSIVVGSSHAAHLYDRSRSYFRSHTDRSWGPKNGYQM